MMVELNFYYYYYYYYYYYNKINARLVHGKDNLKFSVLGMLHLSTPDDNKEAVLRSLRREDGSILVVIATIAFGMNVD